MITKTIPIPFDSNRSGSGTWTLKGCLTRYRQCDRRWKRSRFEQTKSRSTAKARQKRINAAATAKSAAQLYHEIVRSLRRFGQIHWRHAAVSNLPCMDAKPAQVQSNRQVSATKSIGPLWTVSEYSDWYFLSTLLQLQIEKWLGFCETKRNWSDFGRPEKWQNIRSLGNATEWRHRPVTYSDAIVRVE